MRNRGSLRETQDAGAALPKMGRKEFEPIFGSSAKDFISDLAMLWGDRSRCLRHRIERFVPFEHPITPALERVGVKHHFACPLSIHGGADCVPVDIHSEFVEFADRLEQLLEISIGSQAG